MALPTSRRVNIPFFGGTDASMGNVNINPALSQRAYNIYTEHGLLALAGGYVKHIADGVPGIVRRLMRFADLTIEGEVIEHIIACTDDAVYVHRPEGWHALFTGAQSGEWGHLAYQKDDDVILIMGNGLDNTKVWNGVSDELIDLPDEGKPDEPAPKGRHFALNFERVFITGDPTQPDTVFYSRSLNPFNWQPDFENPLNGGGFVIIPTWDGDRIAGLVTMFNEVLVFKTGSIHRIYGTNPSNYQILRANGVYGTKAPQTIAASERAVFYLTSFGVGVYNGNSASLMDDRKVRLFEPNTERLMLESETVDAIDHNAFPDAARGVFFNNRLFISYPRMGSGTNNAIVMYDLSKDQYLLRDDIAALDWALIGDEHAALVFAQHDADAAQSYVYRYDEGFDRDGEPLNALWTMPWQDDNAKHAVKTVVGMRLHGTIGRAGDVEPTVELAIETDRKTITRTLTPTTAGVAQPYKMRFLVQGERFRFTLRNKNGAYFAFTGGVEIEVEYDE